MKTCLIVDDSRTIRAVARRMIEGLNFATVEAENGEEALGKCKASMPVTASSRRTPEATEDSLVILNNPIAPTAP